MKKKLFSMVLSLIMVVTMIPFASFAEDEIADGTTDPAATEQTDEGGTVTPEVNEPLKLSKPSGSATGTGYTKIKLKWKRVESAKGYKIYRYNKSKGKYVLIKTIKSGSTLSYTNYDRKANTTYYYKIKAYAYDNGKKVYSSYSNKITGKPIPRYKKIRVKAYSYTGGGRTATGKKVKKGYIAVDPKVIKMHSKVYVPGYGYAYAEDKGGAIKGKKIDVYYPKRSQCIRWGVRYVTIKVYY